MKQKTLETITITSFLSIVGVLTITNFFNPVKDISYNENRPLAKAPEVSLKHIFSGDFDDAFESYFQDQFVFRDQFIETKSAFKKACGYIENNHVYFASDGSLIKQFQTYKEKAFINNIESINEFLDENQMQAYTLLVPTASTIHESVKPNGAYDINQLDLLERYKTLCTNQTVLPSLTMEDDLDSTYFKTDHHWSVDGAYKGYESICKNVLHKDPSTFKKEEVSDSFFGTMYSRSGAFWTNPDKVFKITPSTPIDVEVTIDDQTYDSIYFDHRLQEKDQYTYYLDGNHPYVKIKTNANTNRKAILIKDSYAHILVPYLICEYDEIDLIDLRYYHTPVTDLMTDKQHTDLYFIYSLDNFCEDSSLAFLR